MVFTVLDPYNYGGDIWIGDSGSSIADPIGHFSPATGTFIDPYRYPVLAQEVLEDLWKCESCAKVYKLSETLECKGCGTSVTEKSRFVLE